MQKAPQTPPQAAGVPFEQYAELAEELAGHPDLLPYLAKLQAFIENDRFVILADTFTNRMLQRGTNAKTLADAVRAVTGRAYEPVFRDRAPKGSENPPINEL